MTSWLCLCRDHTTEGWAWPDWEQADGRGLCVGTPRTVPCQARSALLLLQKPLAEAVKIPEHFRTCPLKGVG